MRIERVAQRGLERAVELDYVHVRDPGGEVLGEDAEPAADLQDDVLGSELREPPDDVEDVRVDQEVLAELAVGANAEPAHPPQRRLDRQVVGHHPKTAAALRSSAASSSSDGVARRSARQAAVRAARPGAL